MKTKTKTCGGCKWWRLGDGEYTVWGRCDSGTDAPWHGWLISQNATACSYYSPRDTSATEDTPASQDADTAAQ